MTDGPLCEVFMLVGDLAHKQGARNIKDQPGLHTVKVDDHWEVKVNPHLKETDNVEPCGMMPFFNGFPAGSFNVRGGIIVKGAAANESSLVEALKAAIARMK